MNYCGCHKIEWGLFFPVLAFWANHLLAFCGIDFVETKRIDMLPNQPRHSMPTLYQIPLCEIWVVFWINF